MNTLVQPTHTPAAAPLRTVAARPWPVFAAVAALVARFQAARERARRRRATHELSDFVLRDIGLSRSELDSYLAEAEGDAPLTRLRLMGPWY
jgi:uncharacterized protein YjiS (DUF1127 family)